MRPSPAVFAQLMAGLYQSEFTRCDAFFPLPRSSRSFSAYDHFLTQSFGQLTYRDSARDMVACLHARPLLQYQMGFRGRITRTNFAYANEHRSGRVFAAAAPILCRRAQRLYRADAADPDRPLVAFALDASMIHLSLQLFPWAYCGRSRAGALKLHTLLALEGSLPVWAALTEAAFPEVKMLSMVPVVPGAFYIMDRSYVDFRRLGRLHEGEAKFLVRHKRNVAFRVQSSAPVDRSTGLRCDQRISLTSPKTKRAFPAPFRRIGYRDEAEARTFIF